MVIARSRQRYPRIAFAVLFVAGLYVSLQTTFGSFGVDADASQAAMLWQGIGQRGPGFLNDWIFTADNWLFSLYPITFSLFALFGPEPGLVILIGWLIFVASVVVSGVVARLLDAPRSAFIVPSTLIFSGLYAHQEGFVSYPASHNVTNLFGLVAFLCLLGWIRRRKRYLPPLLALSLVAGGLSDPWIVAAYALPLTLTSLLLFALARDAAERRASGLLCLATILSLVLIETRAFGAFGFLVPFHFAPGSWEGMTSNAAYLVKDLGGLLNVVPGAASNELGPALASLCAFSLAMVVAARLVSARDMRADPLLLAFCCTILLSLAGVACAFTISATPAMDNSARFLVNEPYLATIGIAVLLERRWNRVAPGLRRAVAIATVMFVAAGIVSTAPLWRSRSITVMDLGARDLVKFLADNNLNYGYGPYWGSKANAATWWSDFRIRIRPVAFDRATGAMRGGHRAQSSRLWYVPGDAPPDQGSYFVFIKNDGEECPDLDVCVNGVVRQFGAPERTLHYDDAVILVWPRPLLQSPADPSGRVGDTGGASGPRDAPGGSIPGGGIARSGGDAADVVRGLSATPERDLAAARVHARLPAAEAS